MRRWVLLACLCAVAASIEASETGHGQIRKPQAHSVPGQAFHDWRTALIAARFTTTDSRLNVTSTSTIPGATHLQPDHSTAQATDWVNIVAKREAISTIKGPPPRSAQHPAAARRLRIAQRLLLQARADADAAARAKAAAAAEAAAATAWWQLPAGSSGGPVNLTGQLLSTARKGRTLTQAGTAHTATSVPGVHPIIRPQTAAMTAETHTASSSSSYEDDVLFNKLTAQLRQQPYKPLRTGLDALESTLMHYVHRGPHGRLYVQDKLWLLKGMEVPNALQLAAGGAGSRSQLLYLLDRAQTLGLNTLRFRAFADGAQGIGSAVQREWEKGDGDTSPKHIALQPAPGILNGTMLSEGMDWLVHECGLRGIRLLPVLTNGGSTDGGGMKQYIDWVDPALTVTDFYTNDTIKSVFLDYVACLLSHNSSLSGLPLREDPVILGWQLAEEASHPGSPSSQTLLAWLRQLGVFMKERSPYQLLLPGVMDVFGDNSPHHLVHNPHAQVFSSASHSPHNYDARCHGTDFWLHHQSAEVDAALAGVFPDTHVACNATCKLDWARQWIRAHLRDALRMNKPLILGGVGALRPQAWRQQVLTVVHDEVKRALQRNHPIGGFILSGLAHPDMADDSGWATYYTSKGVHAERRPLDSLTAQAVSDVRWRRFMNYDSFLSCLALQSRGRSNDKGEASNTQAWVDGWEDVVRAVAALGQLAPSSVADDTGTERLTA